MKRGSGTTTKQIQNAPYGAIFVWLSDHKDYVKALAHKLKRADLIIVSPDKLFPAMVGTDRYIVVDHATRLNDAQIDMIRAQRAKLK